MKKLIAGAIAIVVAYFAVKIAWWMFTHIWTLAFGIMTIAAVVVVAVPLYIIISRRLLR